MTQGAELVRSARVERLDGGGGVLLQLALVQPELSGRAQMLESQVAALQRETRSRDLSEAKLLGALEERRDVTAELMTHLAVTARD